MKMAHFLRSRTMTFDEVDLYSCLAALHWWAYDEPGRDHDFYKAVIEQAGWLALDVGCGAGRLLRSYLRAGLAVEGVDMAADMLAMCREKARAEGLQTVLYKQPLQALDLPQRYAAIIVPCGSFVCVMGRDHALEALRRFYAHLLPGGILAFNVYLPDYDYSQPYNPNRYPTEWKPHVEKTYPEHPGRRLVVERRQIGADHVEQIECEERRYRLYQDDQLVAEEVHAGQNQLPFSVRCAFFVVEAVPKRELLPGKAADCWLHGIMRPAAGTTHLPAKTVAWGCTHP
jgi:SAM-dependent methyltransferase